MSPHLEGCQRLGEHECSCGYAQREHQLDLARASGERAAAEKIATWMEGLAGHFATPNERRGWYRGVAMDIRHMGPWQADAEYRRKQ